VRTTPDVEGIFARANGRVKKMRDAEKEKTNSLIDRELKRLSLVREAKRPIVLLVHRGADLRRIVELLIAVHRGENRHSLDIYRIPGISPKVLRNLPNRCEELAVQLEAMDRGVRQVFFHLRFKKLPAELRSYALNISNKLKARTSQKGRSTGPDTEPKLKLIRYISNATGRPQYTITAQLIRAYLSMNNVKVQCSASSLKMLVHDHRDSPSVNR
jgi:hypothetical protein